MMFSSSHEIWKTDLVQNITIHTLPFPYHYITDLVQNITTEYITIHRFSTKFKIRSCFLMNRNRDYVSLETKFCSACVFLIVTSSKLFALVFDFSALLGDNLN